MSVKQLNAKYFLNEDRILLRMNTLDNSEYKFLLTRRVTHTILKAASELFEKDHQAKVNVEKTSHQNRPNNKAQAKQKDESNVPSAERMITELQESGKQTQFGGAFESGAQYPLGVDPLLVMDAKCKVIKNGEQHLFSLDLVLPGGSNVNLKLKIPIMKNVILLLEEANIQAGWGL